MDWNRKELIVPNKEFITGQLINWTLSDNVVRAVIPVGVAYGSDTELAYNTLLWVAQETPNVMEEPEARVLFMEFGDSSLNFELRVFVPHIDHFLEVKHILHMNIDKAFREVGVEISFPQRDLHIRSIDNEVAERFEKGKQ
jgi:potassium efflux system protein